MFVNVHFGKSIPRNLTVNHIVSIIRKLSIEIYPNGMTVCGLIHEFDTSGTP